MSGTEISDEQLAQDIGEQPVVARVSDGVGPGEQFTQEQGLQPVVIAPEISAPSVEAPQVVAAAKMDM